MDVKVLASQSFLERLKKTVLGRGDLGVNLGRYADFKDVFGENNYGFVLAGDVQREVRTGKKAPVYLFGENLYPFQSGEGIECSLFLPSNFGLGRFPSRYEVEEIMSYLEVQKGRGNIGHLVNSYRGTVSEDKLSILEIQAQGIPVPSTFHFASFFELKTFLEENLGNYVIKHRFGLGGKQSFRINEENYSSVENLNIEDYVVQEEVGVINEKRLIFFDGNLLGSRIILDRHMPWEEEGMAEREHVTGVYTPLEEEIKDTLRVLNSFDAILGCVDWIDVRGRGRNYMEYNGVGTGWGVLTGERPDPYDLNRIVAEKLKEKYLK